METKYKYERPPERCKNPSALPSTSRSSCGSADRRRERERLAAAMTKVHPKVGAGAAEAELPGCVGRRAADDESAAVLTVWRKSLLFNGNGFTVFDGSGNLVFRVDNYSSGSKPEIVLMDAVGKPLFTIRRKKLSLGDCWLLYYGEEAANPQFAVKKDLSLLRSKRLAHMTPCAAHVNSCLAYDIEGSYSQRRCAIYNERRQQLAEIKRKESIGGVAFGADVFHLIVEPGFGTSFAMAVVILLEQMFGSR